MRQFAKLRSWRWRTTTHMTAMPCASM